MLCKILRKLLIAYAIKFLEKNESNNCLNNSSTTQTNIARFFKPTTSSNSNNSFLMNEFSGHNNHADGKFCLL